MSKKRQFSSLDLGICSSDIRDACVGLRVKKVFSIDKSRFLFKFVGDRGSAPILERDEPIRSESLQEYFEDAHITPKRSSRSGVNQMLCDVGVRLHMTTHEFETTPAPSVVASKLRDDLTGCVLRAVDQVFFDRVMKLTFERHNGDIVFLVIEMYDKGNLMLLDASGRITFVWRKNTADGESQRIDGQTYDEVHHNKLESKRDAMLSCTTLVPTAREEKLACVVASFQISDQDASTSLTFLSLVESIDGVLRPKQSARDFSLFLHVEKLAVDVCATEGNKLKAVASICNMGDVLASYVLPNPLGDSTPPQLIPRLVDVVCFLSLTTYLPFTAVTTPTAFLPKLPTVALPAKAVEHKDLAKAVDHFYLEDVAKKPMKAKSKVDKVEKVERDVNQRVQKLREVADRNEEIGRIITLSENRDIVDNCIARVNNMLERCSHEQVMELWEMEGDEDEYLSYISDMALEKSLITLRLMDEEDEERNIDVYLTKGNAWKNAEFFYSQKKEHIEKVVKTEKRLPDALKSAAREKKQVASQAPTKSAASKAPVSMQDIPMPTEDTLTRLGLDAPAPSLLRFPLEKRSELQLEKVLWFFTTPRSIEGLSGLTSFLVIRPRDKAQLAVFTDNVGKYLSHDDIWVYSGTHAPCIIKTSLVPGANERGIPIEVAQEAMVFTAAHDSVGKSMARSPEGRACWGKQVLKKSMAESDSNADFLITGASAPIPPSSDTKLGVGLYFFTSEPSARAPAAIATTTDSKYGVLQFVDMGSASEAKPVVVETVSKKAKATPQQAKQQEKQKEAGVKTQKRKERNEHRKQKKEHKAMLADAPSDDDEDELEDGEVSHCQNKGEKARRQLVKRLAAAAAESEIGSMVDQGEATPEGRTEEYHKVEPVAFGAEVSRLVCSTSDISEVPIEFAVACFAPFASLKMCKYKIPMDLSKAPRGEAADAILSGLKTSVAKRHVGAAISGKASWCSEPYWVSYEEAKVLLSVKRDDVLKQLIKHYAPTGDALLLPPLPALQATKSY